MEEKALSGLMVRVLNRQRLQHHSRMPWRTKLSLGEEVCPEWRSFYKPPLSSELQWRLVYGILAGNNFISILDSSAKNTSPFCWAVETIVHVVSECPQLAPLFSKLDTLFHESKGGLLTHEDFVLGQSKMSIYVRRKNVKDGLDCEVLLLLSRMTRARIQILTTTGKLKIWSVSQ